MMLDEMMNGGMHLFLRHKTEQRRSAYFPVKIRKFPARGTKHLFAVN